MAFFEGSSWLFPGGEGVAHGLENGVKLGGVGFIGHHIQYGTDIPFLTGDKIEQAKGTGQLLKLPLILNFQGGHHRWGRVFRQGLGVGLTYQLVVLMLDSQQQGCHIFQPFASQLQGFAGQLHALFYHYIGGYTAYIHSS